MYNFDEVIDRKNTNALNVDGFRDYIFHADESMKFPYEDDEFIRMWVADMEFATPDVIIDAMRARLDRRIFGYTKIFEDSYYETFANWCKRRYDFVFPKEELVTSNGVIPALYDLVGYMTKPDEKVLIQTPSYAYFKYAAEYHQREYVCSDLKYEDGVYTMDFEDFERKAADERTTMFIFCNPHNPSGRVWSKSELTRLAEIIEKHNLWVISDEIHCDLLRRNQKHIPLGVVMKDYKRLVTAMAPSKTFNLAGMMISNIMIREDTLRNLWLERHFIPENPLSVTAAQAAYEKGEHWLSELQIYLDNNFELVESYLAEHLPKAKFRISEATYLAWVDLSAYFDADEDLSKFFAYQAGVLLEGGDMFVQHGEGFVRLNLACPKATVLEGISRICKAVNEK